MESDPSRFGSSLSKVLYEEAPGVEGGFMPSEQERKLVDLLCARLRSADRQGLHAACMFLEQRVLPYLSGPSMLEVAQIIEEKAPEVIANIPRLAASKSHLRRAGEMSQAFSQENLARLAAAFREEATRA